MEYYYEIIQNSQGIPVKMFAHSINRVSKHWHDSIELLLILDGEISITCNGGTYHLKQDDLIVFNINEIHEISNVSDNFAIAIQIPVELLKDFYPMEITFHCKSFETPDDQQAFDVIRRLVAQMMFAFSKGEDGYKIKFNSLLYDLLYVLVKQFGKLNKNSDQPKSQKYLEKISGIIKDVEENYREDISLQQYAKKYGLAVPYFSNFFKKHMGITFMNYVNDIRLENAYRDLLNTDHSIIYIAEENGFTNLNAFNKLFKRVYGQSPGSYRRNNGNAERNKESVNAFVMDYSIVDKTKGFESLYRYLRHDNIVSQEQAVFKSEAHAVNVDLEKNGKVIKHNWKTLITIGKAREGLLRSVQEQLKEIQKEIGFKNIRFHGIFEDKMMVYDEMANGEAVFNFNYVNELFDFLLNINLKPFIELGFMPEKLARDDYRIFHSRDILSVPKDMGKWVRLVQGLICNCINRYGIEEVLTWHFEFWNEPEVIVKLQYISDGEYTEFYRRTYQAVKEIHPEIQVGGPACFVESIYINEWFDNYALYCRQNGCEPDFITVHSYPFEAFTVRDIQNFEQTFYVSENETFLHGAIEKMNEKFREWEMDKKEIFLTEWNATAWHRDLCSDTCYKSAYLVKNLTENMDALAGFGYWTASDHIEEFFPSPYTFHGGMGLITADGVKKAGYYAYMLLNKMGNREVSAGDSYYITKKGGDVQIIMYNYCHYDNNYRKLDPSNINYDNRYQVFVNSYDKDIAINISGFCSGTYRIRETSVSRESGSAYDQWVLCGSPGHMTEYETEILKRNSYPKFKVKIQQIDNILTVKKTLTPHEVVLIEIERQLL